MAFYLRIASFTWRRFRLLLVLLAKQRAYQKSIPLVCLIIRLVYRLLSVALSSLFPDGNPFIAFFPFPASRMDTGRKGNDDA